MFAYWSDIVALELYIQLRSLFIVNCYLLFVDVHCEIPLRRSEREEVGESERQIEYGLCCSNDS